MEKIHLCNLSKINNNKYYIKWIDLWKDELIVFRDHKGNIKIFSSICPLFPHCIGFHVPKQPSKLHPYVLQNGLKNILGCSGVYQQGLSGYLLGQ